MSVRATVPPPAAPGVARAQPAPAGRGLLRWAVPLLVSGAILAYLFLAQDVDPRGLVPLVRAISLPGLLAYVAVSAAGLLLRALRYRLLLGRPVPFWPLVLVTAVRNMAADLVPARAGAAASYLYLVTARLGLPLEAGVASFALSFILDTLAVAPLLVLAILVVGAAPLPPVILVGASLVILAGCVAALFILAPLLRVAAAGVARVPGLGQRLGPVLHAAAVEVEARERTRTLLPALGLSLLLRLAKYGAYYCLLYALLASQEPAAQGLGFLRVFLAVAGAEVAASLPLPTIMSLGPYEAAGAAGFAFWLGLSPELATLAVTAFHGLSQLHDYSLGLLAWLWIMAVRRWPPAVGSRAGLAPDRVGVRRAGELTEPRIEARAGRGTAALEYLRPLRFDHWIKNFVVPVGSFLALAAGPGDVGLGDVRAILLAFLVSGLVSSVNYAINEVLDAPFDARHPTKRHRPVPSGRVRVGPLLGLTAALAVLAFGLCWALLPRPVLVGVVALFLAGLAYNLPPIRLKDRPYLDVVTESLTNPIRLAIGWSAVAASAPPPLLLLAVWAFGAFLMTGKRLAELRLLGDDAARYRPTFRRYSVEGLCLVQLAYAALGLGALAWLVMAARPAVLPGLPLVAGLLLWAFKMTFEPESPLIDPEHLYRRPIFLLVSLAVLGVLVALARG